jgi:hypothetical protein
MNFYLKNSGEINELKIAVIQLLILSFLSVSEISAQSDTITPKEEKKNNEIHSFSLFGSDEILKVTLHLDLANFTKKPSKNDSFDGKITIYNDENDSINREITIKYRGISRYEICSFPPMQINFKKPLYTDSAKIKKLKLVTHCQPSSLNDEYVIREYLVYKLFNALTDTSFRTRLLKVSYIDSKGKKKPITKYGIFIEPSEMLAKRTNSIVTKNGSLNPRHILPDVMDRLSIFNYMVSNWDWSISGQHNVEIIKPLSYNPDGWEVAVPYDFDLTGVVNADYAIPPPGLGIENVRQPIFNGLCRPRVVYMKDLKRFLEAKEKLYSVVNELPYLKPYAKKDIISFLDQFFNKLQKQKNTDDLLDSFLATCKK